MKFSRDFVQVCVIAAFLSNAQAKGTLIMAFCNGDSLYIGSDSLEMTLDGSYSNRVEKIRSVAKGCCFSLTGLATYNLPSKVNGRTLHFDCPQEMQNAFIETRFPSLPLLIRITNAVAVFERAFKSFCSEAIEGGANRADAFNQTYFTFWGQEEHSDCFYGLGWATEGTNDGIFHATFDSKRNPRNIFLQGESDFLLAFIKNHNDFPTVELSDASKRTWDKIFSLQPVSDGEIIPEMVELFAVHRKYAPLLSSDRGFIGEPYVIWRLRNHVAVKLGSFTPGKSH